MEFGLLLEVQGHLRKRRAVIYNGAARGNIWRQVIVLSKNPRLSLILDTSPLVTLATFRLEGKSLLESLTSTLSIKLPFSVAAEATANPKYADARHIRDMMDSGKINVLPPINPTMLPAIDLYNKLGQGERDTIREGVAHPRIRPVLDDHLAVVIALRFGLRPLLLLDTLVELSRAGELEPDRAARFVETIRL